jgi:CBS domain-containing protein
MHSHTTVKDIMKQSLIMVSPEDTLAEASRKMKEEDCGCLAVGVGDDVKGIITDRDIVVRALAEGQNPAESKVSDFMTPSVEVCRMDDTLTEAADKMHDMGVSRLIVTDEDNKMCGILSFGRIMRNHPDSVEMVEVIEYATGRKDADGLVT